MSLGAFENVGAFVRNCGRINLKYDEACLHVFTKEQITFWSQYEVCEGCALQKTAQVDGAAALVINTRSPLHYAVKNVSDTDFDNGQIICNDTYQFGEFGQYELNVSAAPACAPRMLAEPDAPLLPLLSAAVVLLAMATLWYAVKAVGKRLAAGRLIASYFNREDNELGAETRALTAEVGARPPARSRLRSLDIFRGFCVALMVFVNAGGGGYAVFAHSAWGGLTAADLVFPWFAFAMGEALVLSLHARLRTALPRSTALWQVARRALLLALLGVVLGATDAGWGRARLPGVLQRLAAVYLLAGAAECAAHGVAAGIAPGHSLFRDIVAGWKQWLFTLTLFAIQICVSLFVAAPGCPRGYAGPGGLHLSADGDHSLQNCTGGIAGYIDRVVLGPSHLYQHGAFRKVYQTALPHDPEGLLGVLSGVLVVQAGAHASRIMLAYNHARARLSRWLAWAALLGAAGGALCGARGGGPVPVNKHLWSASYCLLAAALAMLIKAALYFVVDLKNKWGGRPLYYAGQNALFLYVGSELLKRHFPLHYALTAPTHAQLLCAHAAAALAWLAVGVALYRRRVFVTL